MCSSSPSSSPKNARCWSGGRLTSPIRIASPRRRPMKRRRSRSSSCGSCSAPSGMPDRLEQERHGVDAEAGQALGEPVADDLGDLVADGRVGDVEVGLVGVEAVQVPLPGLGVVGPVGVLAVGEHHVAGLLRAASRRPRRRSRGTARTRSRPAWNHGCSVRGVVHDEVGDHADAAVGGRADQLDEVARACRAARRRRRSR